MRDALTAVVQVAISVLIVGLVMPVVVVTIPASRESRVGLGLSILLTALAFVVIRLAWPRRRS